MIEIEYQYSTLTNSWGERKQLRIPVKYSWTGTTGLVSRRDYPKAEVGNYIEIGPYVGRIVDVDYASNSWVVSRCDIAGDALAFLWPLYALLRLTNYRILHTLVIWNVIRPAPGVELSWRMLWGRK